MGNPNLVPYETIIRATSGEPECRKLDEAGIEYYFVYMTGLAGKGSGYRNARNSAELFSQLNPYFVSVDSLTLFPDTELYKMAQQGLFVPAEEKERIRELQLLINNLNIRTHLFANTVSNFTPVRISILSRQINQKGTE